MNTIDIKTVDNYVILSLNRIIAKDNQPDILIHLSALRIKQNKPIEMIDVYVYNPKKNYNEQNQKIIMPFVLTISLLKDWINEEIVVLHENCRKDMEWLSGEMQKHHSISLANNYFNLEDVAKYIFNLKKTSLKNLALHYNIPKIDNKYNSKNKDAINCYLIYHILNAMKKS